MAETPGPLGRDRWTADPMIPGGAQEQIVQEIEWKRRELGSNFRELEQKVRDAADWRMWVRRNPLLMVGIGIGAGFLLSRLFVAAVRSAPGSRNDAFSRGFHNRQPSASKGAVVRGIARFLAAAIPLVREYNRTRAGRLSEPAPKPKAS